MEGKLRQPFEKVVQYGVTNIQLNHNCFLLLYRFSVNAIIIATCDG